MSFNQMMSQLRIAVEGRQLASAKPARTAPRRNRVVTTAKRAAVLSDLANGERYTTLAKKHDLSVGSVRKILESATVLVPLGNGRHIRVLSSNFTK